MLLTEKRKARIIAKFRAGSSPYDIAQHHQMPVGRVRVFLRAMGEEVTEYDPSAAGERDSLWSLSDDERRIAFAERARRGAKETLDNLWRNERDTYGDNSGKSPAILAKSASLAQGASSGRESDLDRTPAAENEAVALQGDTPFINSSVRSAR